MGVQGRQVPYYLYDGSKARDFSITLKKKFAIHSSSPAYPACSKIFRSEASKFFFTLLCKIKIAAGVRVSTKFIHMNMFGRQKTKCQLVRALSRKVVYSAESVKYDTTIHSYEDVGGM